MTIKSHTILVLLFLGLFAFSCKNENKIKTVKNNNRFFSDSSFWNQPIPENAEIDPQSDYFISLLAKEPTGNNFGINLYRFTIPVYEVDSATPRYKMGYHELTESEKLNWKTNRKYYGHGKEYDAELVPVPKNAKPDTASDMHMALIDYNKRIVWDMWGAKQLPDGSWISKTGMKYSLDGMGVFNPSDFDIQDGESVHFHGPGRAPGVPIIAGLIMHKEVKDGEINHKIACANRFVAYKQHVFPAIWTDGMLEGGIPEGSVIQLDPKLDLSQFKLLEGEIVIAKALQKYGAVVVDFASGSVLYGELLSKNSAKTWDGLVREWDGGINSIPVKHYRVLKLGKIINKGDGKRFFKKDVVPGIVPDEYGG